MMFLGSPGELITVPGVADQKQVSFDRDSYLRTLGGKIVLQRAPATRRAFNIDCSTVPNVLLDPLFQLIDYVPAPWFVHLPGACLSNVLPPRATMFNPGFFTATGATSVSLRVADDGTRHLRALINPTGGLVTCATQAPGVVGVPINPGMVISAGIYVTGDATTVIRLRFHNLAGTVTSQTTITGATIGGLTRTVFTNQIAPAGTAWVSLSVDKATVLAGPQIVLAGLLPKFVSGRGAERVSAGFFGADVVHAELGFGLETTKLVLQEVG